MLQTTKILIKKFWNLFDLEFEIIRKNQENIKFCLEFEFKNQKILQINYNNPELYFSF